MKRLCVAVVEIMKHGWKILLFQSPPESLSSLCEFEDPKLTPQKFLYFSPGGPHPPHTDPPHTVFIIQYAPFIQSDLLI
jgi:hypothetical protein